MAETDPSIVLGTVHSSTAHDSGYGHVTGSVPYTDDITEPKGLLHCAFGLSPAGHGTILSVDLSDVRAAPGVVMVLTAQDIPGENNIGLVVHDEPLLADTEILFHGQPVFLVAATSRSAARRAARLARIEIEPLASVLTIDEARAVGSMIETSQYMRSGDHAGAIAAAPHRLSGTFAMGGQEHFYLEGQIAMALPGEDSTVHIYSSTQHPSEIQHLVAVLLGLNSADVTVEVRRMGGGFGGKETQAAPLALATALVAAIAMMI
jgi:xanthine dehydrogenase large subunit